MIISLTQQKYVCCDYVIQSMNLCIFTLTAARENVQLFSKFKTFTMLLRLTDVIYQTQAWLHKNYHFLFK